MTDSKYMRPGLEFAIGKAVEEMGELQQALGKTIRFGWSSTNPELPDCEQVSNHSWVQAELQDVRKAIKNLELEMKAAGLWERDEDHAERLKRRSTQR